MTANSAIPLKWYVPFANGDASRTEIPVTSSDATRASQTLGFPPLTMQPPAVGGVPPQGEDFNGAMNQIARIVWWQLNGGGFPYDSTFATNSNINGYPNGARLLSADLLGEWISTADNNQVNPDTTGTNWVPGYQYGTTALTSLTGGTVTLTPAQAAKRAITLSGTLTSALVLVFPTWLKDWSITNNTSGAFTVVVKTLAGSGITVPQNASPTVVSGDGTNIVQPAQNIVAGTASTHAAQVSQTTGRVLNIRYLTGSGTYTPTVGTNAIELEMLGGGGAGGGAPTTASGTYSCGGGGGGGSYVRKYLTSGFSGLAYSVGAGGTGVSGGTGASGTGTTFGTYTASGGTGGGTAGPANTTTFGYAGGGVGNTIPTGGDVNARGQSGSLGLIFGGLAVGGNGGSSPYGGGGGGVGGAAGVAGTGFGGGGGGASAGNATGPFSGGAGTAGTIRIIEYT